MESPAIARARGFLAIPKEIIFPSRRIAGDTLCNLPALERTSFLIRRRFLLSQALHFCVTWKIGWPFRWNR
jgi:hypothetical protein